MEVAENILPIKTAHMGLCCSNCMQGPSAPTTKTTARLLLQCSACKRAKYCSRECQREDWKKRHKHVCKLIQSFSDLYHTTFPPELTLLQKMGSMEAIIKKMPGERMTVAAKRYWVGARAYISYCRVCRICGTNEYDFLGAGSEQKNTSPPDWVNCPTCQFGWCCSQEHWDAYKDRHTEDICSSFCFSMAVSRFHWNHAKKYNETFEFVPQSVMENEPMEPFPANWEAYFNARCPDMYAYAVQDQLPYEFFPAATDKLSQPATCLFAMYQHGIERFQNLPVLSIHIVGASQSYEIPASGIWEEIMHCLPKVQTLRYSFIGPEATSMLIPPTDDLEVPNQLSCPTCISHGRKRVMAMRGLTYHDFQASEKWSRPDLIVAFNTGMHEDDTESWTRSLQGILDLNIPALFTSYNLQEADQDYSMLRSLDAKILHDAPLLNPVKSMKPELDFSAPDEFFHHNMYCIAFQGRSD